MMTKTEAAELLGVDETAAEDVLQQRYKVMFNEYQMRIANAPIPALKKTYQEKLRSLTEARNVLLPGISGDAMDLIPSSEPVISKPGRLPDDVRVMEVAPPPEPPKNRISPAIIALGAVTAVLAVTVAVMMYQRTQHQAPAAPSVPHFETPAPPPDSGRAAAAPAGQVQRERQTLPGALLISLDDDANVSIDGTDVGLQRAGEIRTVRVALGKHVVRATSARANVSVDATAEIKQAGQEVVSIAIKDRADRLVGRLTPGGPPGSQSRIGPPVLFVAPVLAAFAGEQAVNLQSAGITLAAAGAETGGWPKAELVENDARPAAPTEIGGTSMQTCTVDLTLTLWRRDQPDSWKVQEKGAAAGSDAAAACAAARRKAVRSALQKLVDALHAGGQ